MSYIRVRMRISWTGEKANEEVMEIAGYKTSELKTIKKTTTFLGHSNRARGL